MNDLGIWKEKWNQAFREKKFNFAKDHPRDADPDDMHWFLEKFLIPHKKLTKNMKGKHSTRQVYLYI